MDNFIDDRFTKTAEDAKISWILPSIGLAMGLGNHILQRGNLDPEDRMRHLLRSTLLGGMAGTGAEMMRYGGLRFINRIGDKHQIPDGTEGYMVPKLTSSTTTAY